MTTMQQLSAAQASPEVIINENFETLEHQAVYGKDPTTTTGLTWGYVGGRWGGFTVAAGTLALDASQTVYMVVAVADGVPSKSTASTNWDNVVDYKRVYKFTTSASAVTAVEDHRAGPGGVHGSDSTGSSQGTGLEVGANGFRGIPQNAQTSNYTTVAADAGKHLYHASGAGAGDTYTIDSDANVPHEIGAAITFINMDSNAVSIAIASDTLYLAGTGATGTRALAQYGVATAVKITSTAWIISGTGLS